MNEPELPNFMGIAGDQSRESKPASASSLPGAKPVEKKGESMSKQEISDKQLQNWIDFTKPMTAKNWGGDIAEHLHSALTELQARREAERWIPVSEKLLNGVPNEAGYAECRVQVWQTFFENPQIAKFVLFKDGDWGCTLPSLSGNAKEYVNHWRPLPIPPEVK